MRGKSDDLAGTFTSVTIQSSIHEAGTMLDNLGRRVASALRKASARVKDDGWPLLQATAAATIAWAIANALGDHPDPFFAPIAAVIAMNAERGERGINALRLLSGVFIGIMVAELTVVSLGDGYGRLALATAVAMTVARAMGGARIVLAQAAGSAILTVVTSAGEGGIDRLIDASIGAGVALVFTQVLFSPEPVALLRRAEASALTGLAEGLHLTASALEQGDDDLSERAITRLRDVRDQLADLSRARKASGRVVRHSLAWRSRAAPVVRETENAGHLDLLGSSCLMLARTTTVLDGADRRTVAPNVQELAGAIAAVAKDPGGKNARQRAADRALDLVRKPFDLEVATASIDAAYVALRMVAMDVMVFAGVDQEVAEAAVKEGTGEIPVVRPPRAARQPFRFIRRRPRR